ENSIFQNQTRMPGPKASGVVHRCALGRQEAHLHSRRGPKLQHDLDGRRDASLLRTAQRRARALMTCTLAEGAARSTLFGAHIILLLDRTNHKVVSARVCFEPKMSEEAAGPYSQALYLSSYDEDAKKAMDTVVNIAMNNPEHSWVFHLEEP